MPSVYIPMRYPVSSSIEPRLKLAKIRLLFAILSIWLNLYIISSYIIGLQCGIDCAIEYNYGLGFSAPN